MLMPSIFGEDLFDDFMGYPTGRQAAANAYPQVKDMMKTDIRDVDGNYELDRKSTRLNSSHIEESRMPSSA